MKPEKAKIAAELVSERAEIEHAMEQIPSHPSIIIQTYVIARLPDCLPYFGGDRLRNLLLKEGKRRISILDAQLEAL